MIKNNPDAPMEFTLKKEDFLRELTLIQGVIEKKSTIPILSYIAIAANEIGEDGKITLIGTDMDLSLTSTCPANIKNAGVVTVSAKRLFEIVRNLPDEPIHIKWIANDGIVLTCAKFVSKVLGADPNTFPAIETTEQPGIEANSKILADLIARTSFAITTDESRYALNGALILREGKNLVMVATDAHRLSVAQSQAEEPLKAGQKLRALIPKKTLSMLSKLLIGIDETITFIEDGNHFFFNIGERVLVSRLLSGQFPNYELVLPKDNNKKLVVDASNLGKAVRRVSLMADERSHAVKLSVSDKQIQLETRSSETGEATEILSAEYEGPALTLAFNAQYVTELLSVISAEKLEFALKDEQSQIQIRPIGEAKIDHKYIVMPMRL